MSHRLLSMLIGISLSLLVSCDFSGVSNKIEEATQSTESILLDALDALERNSSSWQDVLQDTITKLTSDTQSTIRNELNAILQRGIAATGSEFRCNADFIGQRVRQSIERIVARLTGKTPAAIVPGICQVVPLAIDRALVPGRLNVVEFYGYDFDQATVTATLLNKTGSINVSTKLDKPTHYHMTLNLGGNGVPLSDKSERVQIKVGTQILSTIGVIQQSLPVCQTKDATFNRSTYLSYTPPRVGSGDTEFDGNGPTITGKAEWINKGSRVDVRLYMSAKETKSDWSAAKGTLTEIYYTPPSGWRVESIVGGLLSQKSYTDSNHIEDRFGMGPGGPVKEFVFRGDHGGKDVGTYTGMEVKFNPLVVKLVQVANCLSPEEAQSLKKLHLLSPEVIRSLNQNIQFRINP